MTHCTAVRSSKAYRMRWEQRAPIFPISETRNSCCSICARPASSRTLLCWISACRSKTASVCAQPQAVCAILPNHFPQQLSQLCNRGLRSRAYLFHPEVATAAAHHSCVGSGAGGTGQQYCADCSCERHDYSSDRTARRAVSGTQSAQNGHLYGAGRVLDARNTADALQRLGPLYPLPSKLLGKSRSRPGNG